MTASPLTRAQRAAMRSAGYPQKLLDFSVFRGCPIGLAEILGFRNFVHAEGSLASAMTCLR